MLPPQGLSTLGTQKAWRRLATRDASRKTQRAGAAWILEKSCKRLMSTALVDAPYSAGWRAMGRRLEPESQLTLARSPTRFDLL